MKQSFTQLKKVRTGIARKALFTCAFLSLILSFNAVVAQSITNYALSSSAGTFTTLVSGTLNPGQGTIDDGAWNTNPIGFDFWYMGNRYSTISASTNGWLALGTPISSYGYVNSLSNSSTSNSTTIRPVLAPLWDDLSLRSSNDFSYQTSGTAGNRIFTAQFLNAEWQYSATTECISFQVKLYEGTGKIEFIYRTEAGTLSSSPSASIGITGNSSGSYLSLNNTGSNPSASSSSETTSLNSRPASGQKYAFTPPVPANPSNLSFTNTTSSSTTVNWSDNSSNEVGFVIYRSNDNGSTYEFVTQVPAGSNSYNQTGLFSSTTYHWKVYSVSEGALSLNAAAGSTTTAVCGVAVTNRTWVGAGNGGSGTVFNASSNWSPVGSPTCADSLFIPLTSNVTITVGSSIEVGAINVALNGPSILAQLNTGVNTLQVNRTSKFDIPSGNSSTRINLNIENGGTIIYNKTASFTASAGTIYPIFGSGGTTGNIKFKGNVSFDGTCLSSSEDLPDKIIFDGPAQQTITFNNSGSAVLLGKLSTEIGFQNNPVVTMTGNGLKNIYGNLNVNGTSTLNITNGLLNRYVTGGSMNLAAGAVFKLAGNTGGQPGSNFPANFSVFSFNSTSTVKYESGDGLDQIISSIPAYGNLTLANGSGTGSSNKIANDNLTIKGNLTIENQTNFLPGDALTHSIQGNWINNGTYISSSINIRFNGSAQQQIFGSSSSEFFDLTLDNVNGILLSPSDGIETRVKNSLTFNNGKITLGNYDLGIGSQGTTGNISGYSSSSFVITNGSGSLNQYNIGTGARETVFYPVGATSSSYTPVSLIVSGPTTTDNYKCNVKTGVTEGTNGVSVPTRVVSRTWDIKEGTEGGSNVQFIPEWNASEELTGFDRSACSVSYFLIGTWWETNGAAPASTGSRYSRSSGTMTSLCPLRVSNYGIALPVKLIDFTGSCDGTNILLQWNTASEQNNDYFTIEKSVTGENFITAGTVNALSSNNAVKSYSFSDPSGEFKIFRLSQTDYNGTTTYNKIISVEGCDVVDKLKLVNFLTLSGNLTLQLYSPKETTAGLTLYDCSGKKVFESSVSFQQGTNETHLNSNLGPGVYLLNLETDRDRITSKFLAK